MRRSTNDRTAPGILVTSITCLLLAFSVAIAREGAASVSEDAAPLSQDDWITNEIARIVNDSYRIVGDNLQPPLRLSPSVVEIHWNSLQPAAGMILSAGDSLQVEVDCNASVLPRRGRCVLAGEIICRSLTTNLLRTYEFMFPLGQGGVRFDAGKLPAGEYEIIAIAAAQAIANGSVVSARSPVHRFTVKATMSATEFDKAVTAILSDKSVGPPFERRILVALGQTNRDSSIWQILASKRELRSLQLNGIEITSASAISLQELDGLRSLEINDSTLTLQTWEKLGTSTNLERLAARNATLTPGWVARFQNVNSLSYVNLGQTTLNTEDLKALSRMPTLKDLDLSFCVFEEGITTGTLGVKGTLSRLTISNSSLRDKDLSEVSRNRALRHLDCSKTVISDIGLKNLKGHPSLESINVDGTAMSEQGLEMLLGCPALNRIVIDATLGNSAAARNLEKRGIKVEAAQPRVGKFASMWRVRDE